MKGGFHVIKVPKFSFILVSFVCATVLVLAWTKTTILASLILSPGRVSQLDQGIHEILQRLFLFLVYSVFCFASDTLYTPSSHYINIGFQSVVNFPSCRCAMRKVQIGAFRRSDKLGSREKLKDYNSSVQLELKKGTLNSSGGLSASGGNDNKALKNKDCNYAKGKWDFDDSLPLYSGYGCKQWLSPMWACRLTQRKDFEYEKLRWQPKECKMQVFTASKFLERMQDKTLAFVGDSLGRQQFQSLMCMVTGGKERSDVLDVGYEYGLVKARGAIRPDGWAYRFPKTNTTILYYWSASLSYLEPIKNTSNPSQKDFAMHLDRPPSFLQLYLHKFDILVLNTGHHWNRGKIEANRWIMHVNGLPNSDMDIADAKNLTIHSIVKWVDSQFLLNPGLKVYFRSLSPRHFFNGDWNTGGTCDNTVLSGRKEVAVDESSDPLIGEAVSGTRVKFLDITGLSELRDEGHISRYSIRATPGMQDCLHWCLPGVPDAWNEILFVQL